ncbi:MAG: hypothetical protein LBG20_00390 [Holosporaceae bacterium]|nr:hypothetical protein [Holosporaceae bacterium]
MRKKTMFRALLLGLAATTVVYLSVESTWAALRRTQSLNDIRPGTNERRAQDTSDLRPTQTRNRLIMAPTPPPASTRAAPQVASARPGDGAAASATAGKPAPADDASAALKVKKDEQSPSESSPPSKGSVDKPTTASDAPAPTSAAPPPSKGGTGKQEDDNEEDEDEHDSSESKSREDEEESSNARRAASATAHETEKGSEGTARPATPPRPPVDGADEGEASSIAANKTAASATADEPVEDGGDTHAAASEDGAPPASPQATSTALVPYTAAASTAATSTALVPYTANTRIIPANQVRTVQQQINRLYNAQQLNPDALGALEFLLNFLKENQNIVQPQNPQAFLGAIGTIMRLIPRARSGNQRAIAQIVALFNRGIAGVPIRVSVPAIPLDVPAVEESFRVWTTISMVIEALDNFLPPDDIKNVIQKFLVSLQKVCPGVNPSMHPCDQVSGAIAQLHRILAGPSLLWPCGVDQKKQVLTLENARRYLDDAKDPNKNSATRVKCFEIAIDNIEEVCENVRKGSVVPQIACGIVNDGRSSNVEAKKIQLNQAMKYLPLAHPEDE